MFTVFVCIILLLFLQLFAFVSERSALMLFPFFRSPLNCVLSLTFDKVTAAEKDGITVIYKSLLDHNADLLPGFDKYFNFTL